MTRIVTPIAAADIAGLLVQASQAADEGADLVELRLDTCAALGGGDQILSDLVAALPRLPLPALVTLRHRDQGGTWHGDEATREALYAEADRLGAAFVDVELARWRGWRPARAGLILSYHDFSGMGGDLLATVRLMRDARCAVAKVAVTPSDAADLAALERLCRHTQTEVPLCAIAMGEIGLPSRLLAGCWGAAFTFARRSGDAGSAPGQPTIRELTDHYRLRSQGAKTRIFGVLGDPVGHSLSPLIHNTAIAHHGLDAVYVPFLAHDAAAFWRVCGPWIDGLSITIPHKHALLTSVDRLEPLAQRIGAMNTIWRDDANLAVGANTDATAATTCLEAQLGDLRGRRVTLLGAGGVSRGIAFALAERGARITIVNRGRERAAELAQETGAAVSDFAAAATQPFDALINGTAVGMDDPAASPWPAAAHRRDSVVFDTVYTPLETLLVKQAQAAGACTICGLSMFIGQALGQYRRWFGLDAPESLMHRTALERLVAKERARTGATAPPDRRGTAGLESTLGGG